MRKQLLFLALAAAMLLPIGASAQSAVTLPYTCGFEAADDATQWTLVNGSYTNKWVIGSAVNNGGTKSLYISNDNGASNAYDISTSSYVYAYFDVEVTEAGQYGLEFDWRAYGESTYDYLRVYLVPSAVSVASGEVSSSWSAYQLANINQQGTWQHYTAVVDVTDSLVGSYHVVFYWRNDGSVGTQPPAAIDNVHVKQITCPAVYNLRTESVDPNSATIAWTPFGTETSWLVYLNGELNGTATDSTYTITGLDANTAYNVGVRALCGAGDTAMTTATIVRTACDNISMPFYDGFESYETGTGHFPTCWSKLVSTVSANYPYVQASGIEGTNNLYWTASNATDTVLVTTGIMPIDASNMHIQFWGASNGNLEVGIMTDTSDISTFVSFRSINTVIGSSTYWQQFDVYSDTVANLDVTASEVYLAFRQIGSGGCWVDEVYVEEIGDCRRPVDSDIDSITYNSVFLTWTPDEASQTSTYDVCYTLVNHIDESDEHTVIVNGIEDTSFTLTGLEPNTHYYVWVRANCGTSQSSWHRLGGFTTNLSCYPVTGLAVESMNSSMAIVTWTYAGDGRGMDEIGAHLILRDSNSIMREWDETYSEDPHVFISGLTPGSTYTLEVRTLCDPDTATGTVLSITIPQGGSFEDGTTTTSYLPFYGFYKYAYTQTLYPMTALTGMSELTGLSWYVSSTPSSYPERLIEVWIGETNMTSFSTTSYVDTADMVRVVTLDTLHVGQSGWTTINFEHPYSINNSGANLVVAVRNLTGQYSSMTFKAHSGGVGVYGYQDAVPSTPYTISSYSNKSTTTTVPDIRFIGTMSSCSGTLVHITGKDASSVSLVWSHAADESSWYLQYRIDTADVWIDAGVQTDTIATVSGLDPRSLYLFRIGLDCDEDTVWSNTASTYTDCVPMTELPFTEGFEDSPLNSDPLCWTVRNFRTSTSSTHYVQSDTKHNGQRAMRVYPYGVCYVISPMLPEGTEPTELEINYWANLSNSGQRYEVGLMTNPMDTSTFRTLYTSGGNGGTWTEYNVYADTTTLTAADSIYVAWRYYVSNGYANFLDDVTIGLATCRKPSSMALVNVSHNSATISWSGSEDATYEVMLTTTNVRPADTVVGTPVEDTVYTFTDLNPTTTYYFWGRTVCSDNTTGWSSSYVFTTPCAPETMPWSENFDQNALSTCWNRYSGDFASGAITPTTSGWSRSNSSHNEIYPDGYDIYFNIWSTNKYTLVTPSISISSAAAVLTFDVFGCLYSSSSSTFDADDRFIVAVSADGGTTWTPLYMMGSDTSRDDMPMTALTATGTTVTVPLIGYEGQTVRIAFYAGSYASGGDNYIAIDNIEVVSADCMRPQNVTVDAGLDTAYFTWNDISTENEAGYQLVISTTNSTTAADALTFDIAVTDSTFTATGLTPATGYFYFLRSACDTNVNANSWASGSFHTACPATVELPYDESFDSYTSGSGNFPFCWNLINANGNYPYVYDYSTTRGNVIYFYGYNSSRSDTIFFATPRLGAPLNELAITFDYNSYSSSYRAPSLYLATDPEDATTYTYLTTLDNTSGWVSYELYTDTINVTDTGYLVFAGPIGSNYQYVYGYLDNVHIDLDNGCRHVESVSVSNVTSYEATVSWPALTNSNGYRVKYSTENDIATADSIDVQSNEFTFTDLTQDTRYYVWVMNLCDDDATSEPRSATFKTEISCYTISNVRMVSRSATGAVLEWEFVDAGNEVVEVYYELTNTSDSTAEVQTGTTTGDTYHFVSGLDPNATYVLKLYTICDPDTSTPYTVTLANDMSACRTLSGTTTVSYAPLYGLYDYSYCQMLYTGTDVSGLDTITGISFRQASTPSNYFDCPVNVWIANTTMTSVSSTNTMDQSQMTLVAQNMVLDLHDTGWVTIMFNQPFVHTNGNVMIAVQNMRGEWSSFSWGAHDVTSGGYICWYRDNDEVNYSNRSSASTSNSTTTMPDIKFHGPCNTTGEITCAAPIAMVTDVDSNSATVIVMAGLSETSWIAEYMAQGDTVWTEAGSVSASPYTLNGLNPATTYALRIGTVCDDDTLYSTEMTFTTECVLESLPYHFTQADMLAMVQNGFTPCWEHTNFYLDSSSTVGYVYSSSTSGKLVMPAVSGSLTGYQLRVVAASTYDAGFRVGITDGTSTEWLDTVMVPATGGSSTGVEYVAYLDGYTGIGDHVVISSVTSNSIYFHELHIEPADACKRVSNLQVTGVIETGASISWTEVGGATQWLVYLNGAIAATATSTNYTFTGLTAETEYTAGVRAFCGGTDTARMVTTTFRTTPHANSLPYSSDFEAAGAADEWTIDNGSNGWYVGTAANHGGTHALYISDDNGTSNHYNISSTTSSYAYRLFNVSAGDYVVSYDWRAYGEGVTTRWDYLRVLLVPGSDDPTSLSGTSTPTGWTALYDGDVLSLDSTWNTVNDTVTLTAGNYYLLFFWRNDGSQGTQPPAAIDNVSFAAVGSTPGPGPQPGDPCNAPTGLTLVSHDRTTATVSWTAGGNETAWELQLDNGQELVSANATTYTFTDLEPGSDHSVRVRAVCSETSHSGWSAALQFSTLGIADVEAALGISLYPNPASSVVAVEASEAVNLNIIDQSGRVVYSSESEATKHSVDVSQMAKGAYYVRLTGQSGTAVRKLIVK